MMNLFAGKRPSLVIITVLAFGLLSACGHAVKPDFDSSVDFSQFSSYQWNNRTENKQYHSKNPFVHAVILEEVDKTLKKNNTRKVSSDLKADLLLDYQMSIEARQSSSRSSISFGTGSFSHGTSVGVGVAMPLGGVQVEKEITLIIQIVDNRNSKTIWRAVGVETFTGSTAGSDIKGLMRDLAEKIMAEYPPGK
jgi:hypothetical protein